MKQIHRLLSTLHHGVLADVAYAHGFLAQVNSLDTMDALTDFVQKNEKEHIPYFANFSATGELEYSSDMSNGIRPGSVFVMNLKGPVIPEGAYGIPGLNDLKEALDFASNEPNISAIVFRLETGGGSVYKLWPFCDAVVEARSKKPVVMHLEGFCASAGVAIMVNGTEVWADHSATRIGSVGVAIEHLDIVPYLEKIGCKYHYLVASSSPDKNADVTDLRKGKYERMDEHLVELHTEFKDRIKAHRLTAQDEALTGKMYGALQAEKFGLIDGLASLDQVVSRAFNLSLIKNQEYVR